MRKAEIMAMRCRLRNIRIIQKFYSYYLTRELKKKRRMKENLKSLMKRERVRRGERRRREGEKGKMETEN